MSARPTWATVNLDHLRHNLEVLRAKAGGIALCPVIKADAYGHGATQIAPLLAGEGMVAVALIEEGIALREAGFSGKLLVLSSPPQDRASAEACANHDLIPTIWNAEHLEYLGQIGGPPVRAHLKVDTGMHRLGVAPEDARGLLDTAAKHGVTLEGVYTHLARSDQGDTEAVLQQRQRFDEALKQSAPVLGNLAAHVGASAAILWRSRDGAASGISEGDTFVRPGLALYGEDPRSSARCVELKPVMQWQTQVLAIRDIDAGEGVSYGWRWRAERPSSIGTLPVGYADGYPRVLGGQAHILIRGQKAPIVGTVCMDMLMVDLTDVPGAAVGDEVVLLGTQGQEAITASALASKAETVAYEVLCGISARVPRRYIGGRTEDEEEEGTVAS